MNAMTFSNRKSRENVNDGASKNNLNGYISPPYLINTL